MLHRRLVFAPIAAVLIAAAVIGGCVPRAAEDPHSLTVAATAVPHAEILEFIKPALAAQGVNLKIKVYADYAGPNLAVVKHEADVNYFQTQPFLDSFNRKKGQHLVTVVGVHAEPFGAYSRIHRALAQLPDGATIALPNEGTNEGRALALLQQASLITLRNPGDPDATVKDITENPRHLKFRTLDPGAVVATLDRVDLALINTNYALAARLDPTHDALLLEARDSPYVNVLVARPDNLADPRVQKLARALTSPQVKAFIEQRYRGAVLPAF